MSPDNTERKREAVEESLESRGIETDSSAPYATRSEIRNASEISYIESNRWALTIEDEKGPEIRRVPTSLERVVKSRWKALEAAAEAEDDDGPSYRRETLRERRRRLQRERDQYYNNSDTK